MNIIPYDTKYLMIQNIWGRKIWWNGYDYDKNTGKGTACIPDQHMIEMAQGKDGG